jgi:hypothetical protein
MYEVKMGALHDRRGCTVGIAETLRISLFSQ